MQYYPFNSWQKIYKEHFGAVASGENLRLRLLLHKDACCFKAYLRIRHDDEPNFKEIELSPAEWLEDYQFFDCELSLSTGIYWYCFRYESTHGEFFVTRCDGPVGHVSRDGECWQQTVYDAEFETPEWFNGGTIYQIFPDRFYNSGKPKSNIPEARFLTENWEKQPEYKQNNGKCSLGNDYYGGDLAGITEKLPYLADLGITCIYLNPIFEADSNHRYNTADYLKIDALLGDEKDLENLCKKAKKLGIRIILDGVFSHTGDNSIYFNKYKAYDSEGAYNTKSSPYYSWFKFNNWPDDYSAWWGIKTLPEVNEDNEEFTEFITGKNGVLRYWLKKGISGWRLDVADELPDRFLENIRSAIKSENKDAYLLGEVWEDATNKISYGARRKFLQGKQLDSVMNYPFANAIIDFIKSGNSKKFIDTVMSVCENYPPMSIRTLMNHIGTHDTARILTVLGKSDAYIGNREWQSRQVLSSSEYDFAVRRLKLATLLQFTLPGVPSIFYGDEAGIQGYSDPFCRATYPWGKENDELITHYRYLGGIRKTTDCLKNESFIPYTCENGLVSYIRKGDKDSLFLAANTNSYDIWLEAPEEFKGCENALYGDAPNSDGWICVKPLCAVMLKKKSH